MKQTSFNNEERFQNLSRMIGNTPLLEIQFTYKGKPAKIYAKAENMNMTGSIKDRMAFYILKDATKKGGIKPGDTIVEATSGNTGISFAALGRALGHPVTILMPDWMSRERVDLIRSLNANIIPVTKEEGGFVGSIEKSREIAAEDPDTFLPSQFCNEANIRAHELTTGPEIWWQLQFNNIRPDAFIAGVGTGGTVMGVGNFLRKLNPLIKIHPLEPEESPTLKTGHKVGSHRIQGISDEFIPEVVKLDQLDDVVDVSDGDSILMAQKLAAEMGFAVGISSGANFIGALKVMNSMGNDAAVVTVFPDDNKKYLSTDLLRKEPVKDHYLSPDVNLTGFRIFKRVCHTCCDMYDCAQKVYDSHFMSGCSLN